ncbi:MAG: DUF4255 domain-containing protein [Leptolyngbyaceae cyanobacterium MO_188.B28]|nr:DUF4255 domain-containing protein [Leptolyngbyaceae cyanobacterium MO_188.B28]
MSNYLAFATVTATLQRNLQAAVQNDVEGARVTTVSPSEIGNGTPETGVNIFLYQVITNPALHNIDATPFRTKGTPVKRQSAMDLYYMFSFYGNNNELAPQRLLGSVVQTLNDQRVISEQMLLDACADSTYTFLRNSDLANQVQQITLIPLNLDLEDLSKTWSVFFQTPYVLSVAYKVLVVLVEGKESKERALPIRDRRMGGMATFPSQPRIEKIESQSGQFEPILPDSTLVIRGKQLKGEHFTQVRIGGVEITPTDIADTQIKLPLAVLPQYALRAGVQSLQVIHPSTLVSPADPRQRRVGTESNAAPFVLRPRVTGVSVDDIEETDDDRRNANVWVEVNLIVGASQRVVLALNEFSLASPTAYMFDLPKRTADARQVMFPVQEVEPGEYLVRLLIDGAESQLTIDTDRDSPTYDWYIGPKIRIL